MTYTLREAGNAVGASKRTIERAVKTGDLPGRKEARGGRDVWTVEAGDLAGWAQATGRGMTLTDPDNAPHEPPQTATGAALSGSGTEAHGTDMGMTDPDKPPHEPPQTATSAVGQAATEADRLRERVRELEDDREFLRQQVHDLTRILEQATRALPPGDGNAPAETTPRAQVTDQQDGRPWWRRIFRGRGEAGNG